MWCGGRCASVVAVVLASVGFVGCTSPKEAISLSETSHDFRSSRQAWNLRVADSNSTVPALSFTLSANQSWLHFTPATATSTGANDVKIITVSVSRQGIAKGTHKGKLTIASRGIVSKTVNISMYSDGKEGVTGTDLNIVGASQNFSSPYLVDFIFSLRNRDNQAVIGEPSQFGVTCREDGVATDPEEDPPFLAKASAKQLKCMLVLDYSASMASIAANGDADHNGKSDAIDAMEAAIKTDFLPALSGDTLVGVYEFHRESEPELVVNFTADKQFVSERIDAIWTQFVNAFWGPSRCWDAVYDALNAFDPENANDENRNIVVLTDGDDTSSVHTKEDVIASARQRGVRVDCIGFGRQLNAAILQAVTEQTNAEYYDAQVLDDISASFRQIIDDFAGQYALRWATLKRTDVSFTPSFLITVANSAAEHTSAAPFAVADYVGDELVGQLRLVPSRSADRSTFFLRATYMPRCIWTLRFFVRSPFAFTVTDVGAEDSGLCAAWNIATTPDTVRGGTWVYLQAPNPGQIETSIPLAAFGPILRFDFDQAFDEGTVPFDYLYVDNTLYTAGQTLVIQGWDNVLPPG